MIIDNKEIKCVVFDLDGTLLDSTNVWIEIDKQFFGSYNMEVPKDYNSKIAHLGLKEAAIFTKKEYGFKESVEEIMSIWNDMVVDKYAHEVILKNNAVRYLEYLKSKGVKLAVATANSKAIYMKALTNLNVDKYFDLIADVSLVNAPKSDPKLYNYIADYFNLDHQNVAIIEDQWMCLKTAFDEGYYTIAKYDINAKDDDLKKKYSHKYINDFGELL